MAAPADGTATIARDTVVGTQSKRSQQEREATGGGAGVKEQVRAGTVERVLQQPGTYVYSRMVVGGGKDGGSQDGNNKRECAQQG